MVSNCPLHMFQTCVCSIDYLAHYDNGNLPLCSVMHAQCVQCTLCVRSDIIEQFSLYVDFSKDVLLQVASINWRLSLAKKWIYLNACLV